MASDGNLSLNDPPAVIDEDMLRKAVDEQGPKERAGELAREEGGVDFADVTALRLDYRNILAIDNLWCFKNVVHLQMSNNVIQKIQNLEIFDNLTHLDLSFNNIEKIEGLNRLTKLEDLSLFNNQITVLENLDTLKNLRLLSVGNNKLLDIRCILYLRRFEHLQSICLLGNPFCEDLEVYQMFVFAFLPRLVFLDYVMVDPELKQKGLNKYDLELMQVEEDDRVILEVVTAEDIFAKNLAYNTEAFVENLDGGQLFDAMYAKDVEGRKFNTYKDIGDDYELYRAKFIECCRTIYEAGVVKHKDKQKELEDFYASANDAQMVSRLKSREKIVEFLEFKTKFWSELVDCADKNEIQKTMLGYNAKLSELFDLLLGYELNVVDQLEDIVTELIRSAEDLHSVLTEYTGGRFARLRELENQHHEMVLVTAGFMADRAAKHEEEEGIDLDLQALIADKVTMIGIINTSHDMHLLVIDMRQDELAKSIHRWHEKLSDDLRETMEILRNRERVVEIYHFIDYHREDGDEMVSDLLAAKTKHVSIFVEDDTTPEP